MIYCDKLSQLLKRPGIKLLVLLLDLLMKCIGKSANSYMIRNLTVSMEIR